MGIKVDNKEKKVLFMINTLSNGGAERVCINLANELYRQGYKVDFIVLTNKNEKNNTYKINPDFEIYDLKIEEKSKFKKIINIVKSIKNVNKIIKNNEKNGKYDLITSHLPMSNILTRFSCVSKRAIYVFHTSVSYYEKKKSKVFRLLLHFVYGKRKIVAVSEGLRKESIQEYKINKNLIKTIYNPIDLEEINRKKDESISIKEKYFLHVGRFSHAKRQDRMIDIFYRGEFYKKYKLLFCGTGELEERIKEKVRELGIEKQVIFLGWQSNIYKWMKNSEVLVCTSDVEAFPMTLIEALCCGTKVVSANCEFGPNEILIGKHTEFLVKPDDINEYIEKIEEALKNYPKYEPDIIERSKGESVIKSYLEFMDIGEK